VRFCKKKSFNYFRKTDVMGSLTRFFGGQGTRIDWLVLSSVPGHNLNISRSFFLRSMIKSKGYPKTKQVAISPIAM